MIFDLSALFTPTNPAQAAIAPKMKVPKIVSAGKRVNE
jgi:hypothetical protein